MVTIALFDSLLGLQHEQLMIELILKHLSGTPHIPMAQKHKINKIQAYSKSVDYFLELTPEVMKKNNQILAKHSSLDVQNSMTIGTNWNHYGLHTNGESLYSNYHAYLYDAHQKIKQTKRSCDRWSDNYFHKSPMKGEKQSKMPNDQLVQMIRSFLSEFNGTDSLTMPMPTTVSTTVTSDLKFDSLQSIGESSGYESMKYRPEDEEDIACDTNLRSNQQKNDSNKFMIMNNNVTIFKNVEPWRTNRSSRFNEDQIIELELSEGIFSQGTVSLGE